MSLEESEGVALVEESGASLSELYLVLSISMSLEESEGVALVDESGAGGRQGELNFDHSSDSSDSSEAL